MYARVTRVAVQSDKIQDIIRETEQQIIPDMKDDPGFKGFYVLGDRNSGDSLILTMWDTEETEETSREKVAQRFGMIGDYLAGQPEPSTTYEVLHSYVPSQAPAV